MRLAFGNIPGVEELSGQIAQDIPPSLYFDDVHGLPEWRRAMTLRLAEEIREELAVAR